MIPKKDVDGRKKEREAVMLQNCTCGPESQADETKSRDVRHTYLAKIQECESIFLRRCMMIKVNGCDKPANKEPVKDTLSAVRAQARNPTR
jgi:hypothetical protein